VTDAVATSKQKEKQESKTTWISGVHSCALIFLPSPCPQLLLLDVSTIFILVQYHVYPSVLSNQIQPSKISSSLSKKQPFLVQNLLIRLSTFGKRPDSLQDTEKG
jgi:hypothetical protein